MADAKYLQKQLYLSIYPYHFALIEMKYSIYTYKMSAHARFIRIFEINY